MIEKFDAIEKLLVEGFSVNDTARRCGLSAHLVWKCIRARPHLAPIAHENGKRNQRLSKFKAMRQSVGDN
jgi:hypothetical protein